VTLAIQNISKPLRVILAVALGLVCFIVVFEVWDKATRYISWSTLTKAEIVKDTKSYVRNYIRAEGDVCLYVVDCGQGEARLKLIKDFSTWDLKTDKDIIWQRRFSDVCEGRTTNIGLVFIPNEPLTSLDGFPPILNTATSHARWSFYLDRFVPRLGRFQSGSFSQKYPFELCTHEKAFVSVTADRK